MKKGKNALAEIPILYKLLCIVAILCFAVIGVIGLILPVIPGLLFLFLAALLLAKIYKPFAGMMKDNRAMNRWEAYWDSARQLSLWQQVQLSAWFAVRSVGNGLSAVYRLIDRSLNKA